MKTFLLMSILIPLISQNLSGQVVPENSSVVVLNSKWSKFRQTIENPDNQAAILPQAAMITANKNFERNRRVNNPVGAPDPNAETIDGRSAALEKNVKESRSPKTISVDGFVFQTKIRNASQKTIEVLFWEYQFRERANPVNLVSHHFLCGVNIKPDKEKELRGFSASSPSKLISVGSLNNKSENPFEEKILINRVEYADGTIWHRKDWKYADLKPSIARALETPWGQETCRSL